VGVEREDAARTFAVGQVEVFGVRAERVHAVASAGDGYGVTGAEEDDLVAEVPRLSDGVSPPLNLGGDAFGRV
jgi:hypothetical protein